MTPEIETSLWYYAQDGQAIGPLPFSSIRALAAAGQLGPDALIAREGKEDWQPLSEVLPPAKQGPSLPPLSQQQTVKAPASQKEKWQESPAVVIASLFLFFPVGLLFLWKSRHFTTPLRVGFTVAMTMILFGLAMHDAKSHASPSSQTTTSPDEIGDAQSHSLPPPVSAQSNTKRSDPIEYMLACIDVGYAISTTAPELDEYRRVLNELATRFELTPDRIGQMSNATVKSLREQNEIRTTNLEMMQGVERATSGGNAKMLGVGEKGFSSAMATLAILMIDAFERKSGQ